MLGGRVCADVSEGARWRFIEGRTERRDLRAPLPIGGTRFWGGNVYEWMEMIAEQLNFGHTKQVRAMTARKLSESL